MAGTLDGKVAIVTGAGRGLGQVMTLGLLDAGARVAAVEIDAPALDETESAAEDRGVGDRLLDIVADVTHDTARRRSCAPPPSASAASTCWSTMPASAPA